MKIHDKDIYYGVALSQIAEHPNFTSINKITNKEGLYQVNDKRILIKYSKNNGGNEWRFTFRKEDFEEIWMYEFSIVLVCSTNTICLLDDGVIYNLIDENKKTQWISVTYPDHGGMRVKGSKGSLSHTIAHNNFPNNLLLSVPKAQEPYMWPPLSKLNFYKQPTELLGSYYDRTFDLADYMPNESLGNGLVLYLGMSTISPLWKTWSEKNLKKVENLIRYSLEFDCFSVEIERITNPICPISKKKDVSCDTEFLWKLRITT